MRASISLRARYRAGFGLSPQDTFVVVSTTWSRNSLLGAHPTMLRQLLAELPIDSYRVAMVVHPNVWRGHGPWQVRAWLADCIRAGIVVIPELEGWRAALIAADCVIGDHGAVTCYGAALGRPVLLGAFPEDEVAAASPVAVLGGLAARLDLGARLRGQVDAAITGHQPAKFEQVGELVTAKPGESARLLRGLFYRLMGIPEPACDPPVHPIPMDGVSPPPRATGLLVLTEVDVASATVMVTRFAADARPDVDASHVLVHAWHPSRRLRGAADTVFLYDDEVLGDRNQVMAEMLADHPSALIAGVAGPGWCALRWRDGSSALARGDASTDSVIWLSALLAWSSTEARLPATLGITAGARTGAIRVE